LTQGQYGTGFLSGPSSAWDTFGTFLTFAADFRNRSDHNILNAFASHFQGRVVEAEQRWNCTALTHLKWNEGFYLGQELVNVVHPAGPLKYMIEGRQYLFSERYKGLHDDWWSWLVKGNALSARSILKKTGRRLCTRKVHHD